MKSKVFRKNTLLACLLSLALVLACAFGGLPHAAVAAAGEGTLQEEIDGSADGATVQLTENCTEAVTVGQDKNITLDLNGFEVSAALTNNGTLTVIDSEGSGAFRLTSDASGAVAAITNNGTLTFDGAVIEVTGTGFATDIRGIQNNGGASLTIESGRITATSSGGNFGNAVYNAAGGTVEEIAGGTLEAFLTDTGTQLNSVAVNNYGTIGTISGGSIVSENYGNGGTGNYAGCRPQQRGRQHRHDRRRLAVRVHL